jgi:hypothetical protein
MYLESGPNIPYSRPAPNESLFGMLEGTVIIIFIENQELGMVSPELPI